VALQGVATHFFVSGEVVSIVRILLSDGRRARFLSRLGRLRARKCTDAKRCYQVFTNCTDWTNRIEHGRIVRTVRKAEFSLLVNRMSNVTLKTDFWGLDVAGRNCIATRTANPCSNSNVG
jgi:hypothetical protein